MLHAPMTLINATTAQCLSPGAASIPPPQPSPLCPGCNAFPVIEGPGTVAISHNNGSSWSNERPFQFVKLANVAFSRFPFVGHESGELLLKTDKARLGG